VKVTIQMSPISTAPSDVPLLTDEGICIKECGDWFHCETSGGIFDCEYRGNYYASPKMWCHIPKFKLES
jgi:hypothetical protein